MTTESGTPAAPAPAAPPATPAPGTPPAAPAPAPAAPAAPSPVDIPTAPAAPPAVSFEPTGDTGLDMALAFAAKNGFGPEHPAIKQAQSGDFTALETLLSEKKVDGFQGHLQLAKEGLARIEAQRAFARAAAGDRPGGRRLLADAARHNPTEQRLPFAALVVAGVSGDKVMAALNRVGRGI